MESKEIFNNHKCYCIALLNQKGIQEMEEYQFDEYTENMFVETLTYNEAESIYMDIFNKFNEKFDLLIDFLEEEDLPAEKLSEAEKITSDFVKTNITDEQKCAAENVLRVIQKAIECGTYVCFEF
ncbi:MAG: hypothetical protein J6J00_00475 [Treponema sp.]|nr:hypothetical protein [Treponema sp.]